MITFPNISPEIFSIDVFGMEFALRWYSMAYIAGFVIAIYVMKYFTSRGDFWRNKTGPLERGEVNDVITYLILGVIIGGRLGYVVFYHLDFYLENPSDIPKVWDGGMSFHGGFLGVVLAATIYIRRNGILLWSCADLIAVASGPGLMLGRIANFINAELWGRPTDVAWGVVFPGASAQDCPFVVGDCARHPSQLYEAGLEGLFLFVVLVIFARLGALRRPGVITGMFLVIYGSGRYFVEFYRVPDPQFFSNENPFGFAFQLGNMGITMGQTLSIPMIGMGLIIVLLKSRKKQFGY